MEEKLQETNQLLEKLIKRRSLSYSFLSGLAQSLGATLGLTLVLGIVAYILHHLPLAQIMGDWLAQMVNEAMKQVGF